MPSETTTACVSLLDFFRIRRGTFPYSVEDDARTIGQTPTTHYTNTCVKLTIVTHSECISIANLSYIYIYRGYLQNASLPSPHVESCNIDGGPSFIASYFERVHKQFLESLNDYYYKALEVYALAAIGL